MFPLTFEGPSCDGKQQLSKSLCFKKFAPNNISWTFSLCWNYACLGEDWKHQPPMTLSGSIATDASATMPVAGDTVRFTFMQPSCAHITASVVDDDASEFGNVVTLTDRSCPSTQLPAATVKDLWLDTRIDARCNDRFMAIIYTAVYNTAKLPPAPAAVCPCWVVPTYSNGQYQCPGIQLPIFLTTLKPAPVSSPKRMLCETCPDNNDMTSFVQCIDPANWDYWTGVMGTGEMAMSYCWRYGCLPPAFARNTFTATITTERFNIARMPGGASYNTTIKATKGVIITVTGPPKVPGESTVSFTGTGSAENDWNSRNFTLPPSGVTNFTFMWTVPPGFDDLSAAVTMDAWPGPPPPSPPPGTAPRCPTDPDAATKQCAAGRTKAVWTRKDTKGNSDGKPVTKCIPNPYYDRVKDKWAFSMCFSYQCIWPFDDSSAIDTYNTSYWRAQSASRIYHPYTIDIPEITAWGLDEIASYFPAGLPSLTYDLYFTALKPQKVDVGVTLVTSKGKLGPYTVDAPVVFTAADKAAPVKSVAISLAVPSQPWLDGNCAAVELRARKWDRPPTPPPRPPLPPLLNVLPSTTVVVAEFECLENVKSQAQLDAILNTETAEVTATLDKYILTFPVAFANYNHIVDCSDDAVFDLSCKLAYQLGLAIDQVKSTCQYAYSNTARRSLKTDSACGTGTAKVYMDFAVNVPVPKTGTLDDVAAKYMGIMKSFFSGFDVCATPVASSLVTVYKLVHTELPGPSRRALPSVDLCAANKDSMMQALDGINGKVISTGKCSITDVQTLNGASPESTDSSDSNKLSNGAVAGIVIACVAGVAIVAALLTLFVKRAGSKDRKAISTAMEKQLNTHVQFESNHRQETRAAVLAMAPGNPAYNRQYTQAKSIRKTMLVDAEVDPVAAEPRIPRAAVMPVAVSGPFEVPRAANSVTAPSRLQLPAPELVASTSPRELPMRDAVPAEMRRSRTSSSGVVIGELLAASAPRPASAENRSPRTSTPSGGARASDSGQPRLAFPPVMEQGHPAGVTSDPVHEISQGAAKKDDEDMVNMVERMLNEKH